MKSTTTTTTKTTTVFCLVLLTAVVAVESSPAVHLGPDDSKNTGHQFTKLDKVTSQDASTSSKSTESDRVRSSISSAESSNEQVGRSLQTTKSKSQASSWRNRHRLANPSWRPVHHVSRRSFDSINNGDLRGMNQNFFGERSPEQSSPYYRRRSYFLEGKRDAGGAFPYAAEEDIDDDFLDKPDDRYSKYEYLITNSDKLEPHEKRGFDSISRWNGGVSGISQNFIGPKRGDFSSFSRGLDRHMFNPNSRRGYKKRQYESVPYKPISDQGLDIKGSNSLQRWLPEGFRDASVLTRALQNLALLEDDNNGVYSPLHQEKREFDSISHQSPIFGMHQNHIGKRQFDSISTGHSLSTFGQNFINKRQFDSINQGSGFSNMDQNFINKRDLEIVPSVLKRFDSIATGNLNGFGQNFISKRALGTEYYPDNWDFYENRDNLDTPGLMGSPGQHFISRRSTAAIEQEEPNNVKKRQFDSINSSAFSGMGQNFFAKKSLIDSSSPRKIEGDVSQKRAFDTIARTRMGGMSQNFISKRILDSISKGRIGGLNQNFVSRRGFDSINDGQFGGMRQNFVSKRGFDSINRGQFGGMRQNFVSRRGFDSINDGHFGGMSQNFVSRKRFDSIANSRLHGMGQNFFSKRYFDSINENRLGGMSQNFIGKRSFDSISRGPVAGFRQNFVSNKRFDTIGRSRLHGMGQNFISKRLSFLANNDGTEHHSGSILESLSSLTKNDDDEETNKTGSGDISEASLESESDMKSKSLGHKTDESVSRIPNKDNAVLDLPSEKPSVGNTSSVGDTKR